ncbi:hypothetical protein ACOMHN_036311 [Nucella lapillus]
MGRHHPNPNQTFAELEPEFIYFPVAAFAAFASFVLYKFISPCVSRKLWKNYDSLSEGLRLEWDTRVLSSVHAVVVSAISTYSHFFDDDMHANLIWWDSPVVRAACSVVAGYLTFDLVIITIHFKHLGQAGYYFHHAASVFAYYYAMCYAVMPFFANFRLLAEISTSFLNMRWFFLVMGTPKTSRRFLLNGVLLLVTFLLCRVLAIPAYWRHVHVASLHPAFSRLGHIPVILVITCVVLDTLNVYWFYKLLRGVLKVVSALSGAGGKKQGRGDNLEGGERLLREPVKMKSG